MFEHANQSIDKRDFFRDSEVTPSNEKTECLQKSVSKFYSSLTDYQNSRTPKSEDCKLFAYFQGTLVTFHLDISPLFVLPLVHRWKLAFDIPDESIKFSIDPGGLLHLSEFVDSFDPNELNLIFSFPIDIFK